MSITLRTHMSGLVNASHIGSTVTINGWVHRRRDHGGVIFIDARDRTGLIQLVFDPAKSPQEVLDLAHSLRNEFVISATGTVVARAPEVVNAKLSTGEIEVAVEVLEVLNTARPLPFQLDEAEQVDEELRLKYRYVDLRREKMHHFIKLRHEVTVAIRQALVEEGFYDIETPIFTKSTPGGARDFLVPSRLQPGNFYALPQSPQLYKQLLMVAGMERYFQIARCFRDEDLRANRQPEFTQVDIEMAFVDEKGVQNMLEKMMARIFKQVFDKNLSLPFDRMTYEKAFDAYGNDKPDRRFDLTIKNVTTLFSDTALSFLQAVVKGGGSIGALCVKNHPFTRSELENIVSRSIKDFGAKGLLYIRFNEDQSPDSPVAKFLAPDFYAQAKELIPDLSVNDTLLLVAGSYKDAWTTLGRLRLHLGHTLQLVDTKKHDFLWVTEFPLFEYNSETKRYAAAHHPFTQPAAGWESLTPDKMRARAYDIVYNGEELGGGSIRIHDQKMQSKVFDLLGISPEEAHEKFEFLLEALHLGCPPMGGIALGLDRFIMLLVGASSIREVIAFPKAQSGICPMTEAPSAVTDHQLQEAFIQVKLPASHRMKMEAESRSNKENNA